LHLDYLAELELICCSISQRAAPFRDRGEAARKEREARENAERAKLPPPPDPSVKEEV
jgi:hypothetical protein